MVAESSANEAIHHLDKTYDTFSGNVARKYNTSNLESAFSIAHMQHKEKNIANKTTSLSPNSIQYGACEQVFSMWCAHTGKGDRIKCIMHIKTRCG